jgi:hypothetical protein
MHCRRLGQLSLGLRLGPLRGKGSLHSLAKPRVHRDRLPARPGAYDLVNRIQKLKIGKGGPSFIPSFFFEIKESAEA